MNIRKRASLKQLRAALLSQNLSFASFARKHGYSENTVKVTVFRYWGKDGEPIGELTKSIIKDLESYFYKTPNYMEVFNESHHAA